MTTEAEYLAELADLQVGGGEISPYLARCRVVQSDDALWWPFAWWVVKRFVEPTRDVERYDIALYPAGSPAGARPLGIVPVARAAALDDWDEVRQVEARGEVLPGRAVIVKLDGVDLPTAGPCDGPRWWRRRSDRL